MYQYQYGKAGKEGPLPAIHIKSDSQKPGS
jgi:hypothetical protein